jgi:hypothetical protein
MDDRTEDRIRTQERVQAEEGIRAEERIVDSATGGRGRPVARSSLHGPPARSVPLHQPESRDANVRDALDTALNGAVLSDSDRQFLSRLVKSDRRTASAVVSLIWRARLAGRAEVGLTARQLEMVLVALRDAATYRDSGIDSMGCWACENVPGGRCSEHVKDIDRARACTELASALAAGGISAGELPQPSEVAGYRRFATVAS